MCVCVWVCGWLGGWVGVCVWQQQTLLICWSPQLLLLLLFYSFNLSQQFDIQVQHIEQLLLCQVEEGEMENRKGGHSLLCSHSYGGLGGGRGV